MEEPLLSHLGEFDISLIWMVQSTTCIEQQQGDFSHVIEGARGEVVFTPQ